MARDYRPGEPVRPSHVNQITPDDGELITGGPSGPVRRSVDDFENAVVLAELTALQADVAAVADVPPRVAAVETAVGRVAPENAGNAGQQLRVSVTGPRWRDPDSVSPLDHGGVGDGVADDYAAIMAAVTRLGPQGGKLDLGGKPYRSNTPLELTGAYAIDGGVTGRQMGSAVGATLIFPDGSNGLIIDGDRYISVSRLSVKTDHAPGERTAGTGRGISIKSMSASLDRVSVAGFGGHGIYVKSGSSDPDAVYDNANFGQMNMVSSSYNGGDGFHWSGQDTNCWTVIGADATHNEGWGYSNDSMYNNTFIMPHANGNTLGDFYDDSYSAHWIAPYTEGGGRFVVGNGSNAGTIRMGNFAAPVVWSGSPAVQGYAGATLLGWDIRKYNKQAQVVGIANATDTEYWQLLVDNTGPDQLSIRHMPSNTTFFFFDPDTKRIRVASAVDFQFPGGVDFNLDTVTGTKFGTGTTQKIGFFNATPVVRPAAVTGATDTERLNDLMAKLQALGLIG